MQHHTDILLVETWEDYFKPDSRFSVERYVDVVTPTETITKVYYIERGAVVETRSDIHDSSHVISLSGPTSIIGIPHTSQDKTYGVHATTLLPTVFRSMLIEDFELAAQTIPYLTHLALNEIARRTEAARRFTDSCQHHTTSRHILDILESVYATFGTHAPDETPVAIPAGLLERMCGCPWLMVRNALADLSSRHLITITDAGITLTKPIIT